MKHDQDILAIFKESGALWEGHFILRSGRHSAYFFQCARIGEHLERVMRLAAVAIQKLEGLCFDTVVAVAMGGLVFGQELARQIQRRYLFLEKKQSQLELRRGFKLRAGEKILIVEDVVTQGSRVREALDTVRAQDGVPVGVVSLVDRSEERISFDVPFYPLLTLSFPTYAPTELPAGLERIPAVKLGS